MILLFLSFSGCSPKIVIQKELYCFSQETLEPLQEVQIRIHKDDLEVAKLYKEEIENRFDFYTNQVQRNNNLCKEK